MILGNMRSDVRLQDYQSSEQLTREEATTNDLLYYPQSAVQI